jgi:hypothetical protein
MMKETIEIAVSFGRNVRFHNWLTDKNLKNHVSWKDNAYGTPRCADLDAVARRPYQKLICAPRAQKKLPTFAP